MMMMMKMMMMLLIMATTSNGDTDGDCHILFCIIPDLEMGSSCGTPVGCLHVEADS